MTRLAATVLATIRRASRKNKLWYPPDSPRYSEVIEELLKAGKIIFVRRDGQVGYFAKDNL